MDCLIKVELISKDSKDKPIIFSLPIRNVINERAAYRNFLEIFKDAKLEGIEETNIKIGKIEIKEIAPKLRYDLPHMYLDGFLGILDKIKQGGEEIPIDRQTTRGLISNELQQYKYSINGRDYIALLADYENPLNARKRSKYIIMYDGNKVVIDLKSENNFSIEMIPRDSELSLNYINSGKKHGLFAYEEDDEGIDECFCGDVEMEDKISQDSSQFRILEDFSEFIGREHLRKIQRVKQEEYEKEFEKSNVVKVIDRDRDE